MVDEVPFYVLLSEVEDKMVKNILSKYGFHTKAEFARHVIKELHAKGEVKLTPINIKPLGLD